METTITIARSQEDYLGKVVVLGKKMLGKLDMRSTNEHFILHWKFKAPEYKNLFLKKVAAEFSKN
ncbi:hypothetical protein HUK80_07120 [Flavobacterium sp. MAH-1]|uniref:Uncharacterized protein n=1 Tax=Flavobacterium agri TaxID=2743471 RepID=A0A7Y9C5R3_9FLAO|nr:hypothetical protein [Flavobacterium agri]NUY80660.1 hypothetical protein [Flavobacterium agri]NYA70684.1 hypothetical protein [Flavobacterium agri]